MAESSTTPKRKASGVIESPSKRVTWATASDPEHNVLDFAKDRITIDAIFDIPDKKILPGITSRMDTAWQLINQRGVGAGSTLPVETTATATNYHSSAARRRRVSSQIDNTENGETIDDIHFASMAIGRGSVASTQVNGKLPTPPAEELTPPAEEGSGVDIEQSVSSVTIRGVGKDQEDAGDSMVCNAASEGSPVANSACPCARVGCGKTKDDENVEIEHFLSVKEYVTVKVSFNMTLRTEWAKVIDVSCTYNGIVVASASAHLISRELIRGDFYDSMEKLGMPTSDRINELLDHHGYFRWSIKEYYLRNDPNIWDNVLDEGPLLQIDEILVNKEWRHYALGSLIIESLLGKAQQRDSGARLAYVLLSTGSFWNVEETGFEAFDKSDVWAEQNYECFFLEQGFTRVADSSWYVVDITDENVYVEEEFEEKFKANIVKGASSALPV